MTRWLSAHMCTTSGVVGSSILEICFIEGETALNFMSRIVTDRLEYLQEDLDYSPVFEKVAVVFGDNIVLFLKKGG